MEMLKLIVTILSIVALILLGLTIFFRKGRSHASSATGSGNGNYDLKVIFKVAFSFLFLLLGGWVLWMLYNPDLELTQVGGWAWKNVGWLLLLAVVGFLLLELNKKLLGEGFVKSLKQFGVVVLAVLLVGWPIGTWVLGYSSQRTSSQSAKVLMVSMPANGNSAPVTSPVGYAVAFTGEGFTTHCVYTSGTEGIVGNDETPCHDGPILYQYVRDTTGEANAVTYAFVR